jgi:hypothetical protein
MFVNFTAASLTRPSARDAGSRSATVKAVYRELTLEDLQAVVMFQIQSFRQQAAHTQHRQEDYSTWDQR